ncbi:hypothetical protein GW17_00012354, partial [Ensete ventricosum]
MKNSWNDIISLLPLQEFMSLTSVQGKLHASTPCSIFYVNSLHAAWILQLLHPLICIEFMVALVPTISRVSPLFMSGRILEKSIFLQKVPKIYNWFLPYVGWVTIIMTEKPIIK